MSFLNWATIAVAAIRVFRVTSGWIIFVPVVFPLERDLQGAIVSLIVCAIDVWMPFIIH